MTLGKSRSIYCVFASFSYQRKAKLQQYIHAVCPGLSSGFGSLLLLQASTCDPASTMEHSPAAATALTASTGSNGEEQPSMGQLAGEVGGDGHAISKTQTGQNSWGLMHP